MDIGVAARAQGMGGAFTAVSGDVTSAYYNPAGLSQMKNTQISFMHTQQLISSVNYDFLAFGRRQNEKRVWAVSLIRLGIDNIKDSRKAQVVSQNDPNNWRIDWDKVETFNAADYIFTLSVAQQWKPGWTLGGNLKIIRRDLADYSANGIGFDLGIFKHSPKGLLLGAALRNATTTLIAWDTGEKELVKPALYLGGSYSFQIDKFHLGLQPVVDLIFRAENRKESARVNMGSISLDGASGIELSYYRVLFLRTGLDEIGRFNMGAGINIPHIRIDYAFTNYSNELGNSHRIGLIIFI
ncbi:MAG: hypothetical protein Kow0042_10290 [Calditrichia bacterium]